MHLEDIGLIGNCRISALVERTGSIVWCCLPRFDSEPVFGRLLDPEGGEFSIAPAGGQAGRQRYLENTNILETSFEVPDGRFRIVDLAPRFVEQDRIERPPVLLRIIEPLEGEPLVRVRCAPRRGWCKAKPWERHAGSRIEFHDFERPLTLAADLPGEALAGEPFRLTARRHLALSWGAPVAEDLAACGARWLELTTRYWQRWVKHCNIPPVYQTEVIRSALALKLHCFEETGAILAALTTSIPEAPGSGRTWDYRYCWLRDAYYVLGALRLLGHFEEREQFIQYLIGIAANAPDLDLRPLYRIDGSSDLEERIIDGWAGFNGDGPVRTGNAAALHQQHDVFGEMLLALSPVFLDERFNLERSAESLKLVERLARKAIAVAGTPDAGIWEYRRQWEPQTFSSLMCWAAADRMALIADRHLPARAGEFRTAAARIRDEIVGRAWNPARDSFVSAYGGNDLDAALLQMAPLRMLDSTDPRLRATVAAIRRELTRDGWLFRYHAHDGLGVPSVAFVICTFWLVEALAATGAVDDAREVMRRAHGVMSPLGLLSEDIEPTTRRMWGNFPQAYSHVGLIHAAFAASPRWAEVL